MNSKKYIDLYNNIKSKILCGEYTSLQKLPSKRIMADRTGYSLITVEKAYSMLEEEGYIFTKERVGYFVCHIDLGGQNHHQQRKEPIRHLPEPDLHADADFEYSLWFKTVRKVIADKGDTLFVKAPNQGCNILRNAIADYLYRYRNMLAQPEQIAIGSGAEQLYESVVKILGRDKIYGIENPCYHKIPDVYKGMGATTYPLEMGDDGITEKALLESHIDVLHVTPFHSYPSGVTTSISKRYTYLNWAKENNSYIIEDDFDSEFFIPGHPIQSLYSLDDTDSVIYINTFSKSLSPAMRIGYMILPSSLMDKYHATVGQQSCSVPVMDQYILAEFISGGSFERHLNRMRRKMKKD